MPLPRNCLDNSQLASIVSELSRQFSFCLDGFGIAATIPVRRGGGRALPCKLAKAKAKAKAKRLALATDAFGRALANAGERGYLYFQTRLELQKSEISKCPHSPRHSRSYANLPKSLNNLISPLIQKTKMPQFSNNP